MIGARRPDQHAGLDQRAHALLQKEGIALGALDQQWREGREAGVVPQEGLQQFVGARGRQWVEPQLRVVGLTAPAMLILGAVVDQQQQVGRRQAFDQTVEQRLRLGVDPVQVLEDQQQGLHLAFAQQHPLERGERALPPLRGIERQEGAVGGQRVQERQTAPGWSPGGPRPGSGGAPSLWPGRSAARRRPRCACSA